MTEKLSIGFGLLFILLNATLAMATSDDPALPLCRPAHEFRTPVPIWSAGFTRNGKLASAPPQGNSQIVYIDLVASWEVPTCDPSNDDKVFTFDVPNGGPNPQSGGLRVNIFDDEMNQPGGGCIFKGFYANEPVSGVHEGWSETNFRRVDKFEVMASGRYCKADAKSAPRLSDPSRLTHAPAPPLKQRAFLPTCRRFGEDRTPVPVWQPKVTNEFHPSSEPPQGDGKFVYISIVADFDCAGAWQDRFEKLRFPNDTKDLTSGGFEVALRGNIRSENGHCVWSGLFMNELPYGGGMGWLTTVFLAVDESKVATSGQYCLARHHRPLHRPSKQQ
jgi:hypothetical protein